MRHLILTYLKKSKHPEQQRSTSEKSINTKSCLIFGRASSPTIAWWRLVVILFFLPLLCVGQNQISVEGMVADSAIFKPMTYVNIIIKNKLSGSQSDGNGEFKLTAALADTLVFSFVGYKTTEILVSEWVPGGVVLMAENPIILKSITILGSRSEESFYEDIFREENALWEKKNKRLPFYLSKAKKEGKMLVRLENENERVRTYMDIVALNVELKKTLMTKYNLDEKAYYDLMAKFNQQNYKVMYYVSASELLSLVYRFYEANANP